MPTLESLDLELAVEHFIKTKITEDTLANIAYADPRLANIIANNCTIHGLISRFSEIKQSAIILFHNNYVKKLVKGEGVYSLFYAIVQNLCREAARESMTHDARYVDIDAEVSTGEDDTFNEGSVASRLVYQGESLLVDGDFEGRAIESIDQQLAEEEFAEKMTRIPLPFCVDTGTTQTPLGSVAQVAKKAATPLKDAPVDPSHIEFERLFNESHLPQHEFAEKIIINGKPCNVSRLVSYLYRRTRCVPEKILIQAREIHAVKSAEYQILVERFKNRSIDVLVEQWKVMLNDKGRTRLASILQVNEITIMRWEKQDCAPDLRKIATYDDMVHQAATCGETVTS